MKVCMLAEMLPPAFGGAARQALQLAGALRDQGVGIFFVGAQVTPESPRTDTLNGFPVFRVPHTQRGKWTKLRGVLAYWGIFWRQRREFDVLHLHSANYLTLAAAWFAKFVLGKRVLIKLTSIAVDIPSAILRRSYPRFTWWMFRQADAWVCMSQAQLADCRQHGLPAERIHLIPNGADTERFRPPAAALERAALREELGLSPAGRYVVFIGTVEVDKGLELLVATAEQVCAHDPLVEFLIIGPDGSQPGEDHVRLEFVARIREKIARACLEKRMRLLGHRANVAEYLRIADVFAFPSRSEGFGTVLIEAMASGVPCVALRISGVTDAIVDHEQTGIIVERENAVEFATALGRVLDGVATWPVTARQTAVARFGMPEIARRYAAVYATLGATGSS